MQFYLCTAAYGFCVPDLFSFKKYQLFWRIVKKNNKQDEGNETSSYDENSDDSCDLFHTTDVLKKNKKQPVVVSPKQRGRPKVSPIKKEPIKEEETEDERSEVRSEDSTDEEEVSEVSPTSRGRPKKVAPRKNTYSLSTRRKQATQKTTAQRKKSRLKIFSKREDVLKEVVRLKMKRVSQPKCMQVEN